MGNRTVMTDTKGIHVYEYDTANRLTSVDGVAYTWDARGNLLSDGTFTYTYNAAGWLVRCVSHGSGRRSAWHWVPHNPVGYTGEHALSEAEGWFAANVGLEYLRARWYDVQIGF